MEPGRVSRGRSLDGLDWNGGDMALGTWDYRWVGLDALILQFSHSKGANIGNI